MRHVEAKRRERVRESTKGSLIAGEREIDTYTKGKGYLSKGKKWRQIERGTKPVGQIEKRREKLKTERQTGHDNIGKWKQ